MDAALRRLLLLAGLLGGALWGAACVPDSEYDWGLPEGTPVPVVPDDNPMSEEKVELGRRLFYDRRLSSNAQVSCSTCHQQRYAFASPARHTVGVDGQPHPRNAPSLANAGYHARYNWASPELDTLETHLRGPLFGENAPVIEMGLVTEALREEALARLRADPVYVRAFPRAFPGAETFGWQEIIYALASFQRSLISLDAPIDRFRRGEASALTEAAQRGASLFNSHRKGAVCHHCHNGLTFSNDVRHSRVPFGEVVYSNVGLYNVGGTGDYPAGNQGLYESTGNPNDRGKFRTPSLRNVAVTAPYMHDGSVATLQEALDVYQHGGRMISEGPLAGDGRKSPIKDSGLNGMTLDPSDMQDLIAFLEALTDEAFLTNPHLSNPEPDHPSFGE